MTEERTTETEETPDLHPEEAPSASAGARGATPGEDEPSAADGDTGDPVALEDLVDESMQSEASPEVAAELEVERELEDELNNLQAELDAVRDKHLRLAADFDNYRKRADTELTDSWVRAQADFLRKLLDALDDLQRVGDYDRNTTTVEALHEGVDLVERKIAKALADAGVEVIAPEGEVFDPTLMEAVMSVPVETAEEDDLVKHVFQKGYRLKGYLVRPARVSVQQYE